MDVSESEECVGIKLEAIEESMLGPFQNEGRSTLL